MFKFRTSAQKPDDELLADFRQRFHEIGGPVPTSSSSVALPQQPLPVDNSGLGPSAPPPDRQHQQQPHPNVAHDAFRDQDPTPRASNAEWRFTPSLLEPNAFAFSGFPNQAPGGYYTPTPGGTNTLYHPQAGDLATPSAALGIGLSTPLSLPTSEGAIHAGHIGPGPAHGHGPGPGPAPGVPQLYQPGVGYQAPFNAFMQPVPSQQQSFPPTAFLHQDTGYETMDHDGSPLGPEGQMDRMGSMNTTFQSPPSIDFHDRTIPMTMEDPFDIENCRFRWVCALNAPTAMIRHADEIPITYLNKGQLYHLGVLDKRPDPPLAPGMRYRTFVRISFEDGKQRQRPGLCWDLWKEGRGTNEAHQRGGRLQAVEYVDPAMQPEGAEKNASFELESSSFDGFCVTWVPRPHMPPKASIPVRFNFLSTDFSHSKGVKGIPVRLCAKTSIVSTTEAPAPDIKPEICYCKVKLFRDHGAERKLANDITHVQKAVDKIQQQISQIESGAKDVAKRKQRGTHYKQEAQGPGKAPKHKRTWSMSSASSADGGARLSPEEDLQLKLREWQMMFSSTRTVSHLLLDGEELDDPDLHPVSLGGNTGGSVSRETSAEGAPFLPRSARSSVAESSIVSPSPSSMSIRSQDTGAGPWIENPTAAATEARLFSDQPTKVFRGGDGSPGSWFDAIGVDTTYKPPSETPVKPVACFYIAPKEPMSTDDRLLYRAIYLYARSLSNFVSQVAAKWNIDPAAVTRVVHVVGNGLEVVVDDDVIMNLSEGQQMTLEVAAVDTNAAQTRSGWEMMAVDVADGDRGSGSDSGSGSGSGYELRLTF